jgi:hypothetical protein
VITLAAMRPKVKGLTASLLAKEGVDWRFMLVISRRFNE